MVNYQNASGVAASRYTEQEIRSADPLALVVRVYEIASQNVSRARTALEQRDWATKGKAVNQASRSIALLQATLDKEMGGEVAANLDRLYSYFQLGLSQAHINNDDSKFEEIAKHINELLSAWREATKRRQASSKQAAQQPAAEAGQAAAAG